MSKPDTAPAATPTTPAPPPLRLVQIIFSGPPLPEALGSLGSVTASSPGKLRGWSISLRGGAVFLISPPGFVAGQQRDPNGKRRRIVELPRTDVRLSWDTEDPALIDKLTRFDSGPLMPVSEPPAEPPPSDS